jgi:hypothetical protein
LTNLAAAGIDAKAVDTVIISHDHGHAIPCISMPLPATPRTIN